jgi:hypothetical protein
LLIDFAKRFISLGFLPKEKAFRAMLEIMIMAREGITGDA